MAVLGAGLTRAPMSRNIAAAGCRVTVWNRTPGKGSALGNT
ncbi:NAD(P)-binding domain-containing protein [Leisingera sp.]|nr:NAD(P)-binding domain-containing protein [Leisingera sp.]